MFSIIVAALFVIKI